jgi:S1-C subfamily serine protease
MKKYSWLLAILGVAVLAIVLVVGAAFGAGLTYYFLQANPVQAAFVAPHSTDNSEGVLISAVEPGSPADEAGLVRGDILLEVNGNAVNNLFELQTTLGELAPGESAKLTVLHGDETLTLSAELGDNSGLAYLGVNTCGGPMGDSMMFNSPMGDLKLDVIAQGARITEVIADSPAEAAGLQVGDVILSVGGDEVNQDAKLADLIQAYAPGDTVSLEIQSEGADQSHTVEVTLAENPDQPGQAYLGIGYRMAGAALDGLPLDNLDAMPRYFFHNGEDSNSNLPEGSGEGDQFFFRGMPELPEGVEGAVVISQVMQDTPAAQADLQPGDLILAIDDEPVTKVETFTEILQSHKPGDEVTLTVLRADGQFEVSVTLGEHPDDPTKGFLGVMAGTFVKMDDSQLPGGSNQEFQLPGVPGGDA